jgi:hypothetical protein
LAVTAFAGPRASPAKSLVGRMLAATVKKKKVKPHKMTRKLIYEKHTEIMTANETKYIVNYHIFGHSVTKRECIQK